MQQTTIQNHVQCTGIGLHSGKEVMLGLRPAVEHTGVVFHLRSEKGHADFRLSPEAVSATELATTLSSGPFHISTVEHLLASLRGMQVDNVHIDVNADEVPIMDGSAAPFVDLIRRAGVVTQKARRRMARIKQRLAVTDGSKSIVAEPFNGFLVDYTIEFPHQVIGRQRKQLVITPQVFAVVAKARTFGFLRDVEMLQSQKRVLGGNLSNAIVLDETGVINPEGLRFPDEFVIHKVLDFVGDMAMYPVPLLGKFTVHCSGHGLNNLFVRTLLRQEKEVLDFSEVATSKARQKNAVYAPNPLEMPAYVM